MSKSLFSRFVSSVKGWFGVTSKEVKAIENAADVLAKQDAKQAAKQAEREHLQAYQAALLDHYATLGSRAVLTQRQGRDRTPGKARPAGSKLARKAAKGSIGLAVIR